MPTPTTGQRSRTTVSETVRRPAFTTELPEPREHELVLEPSPEATRAIRAAGDELPAAALGPLLKRFSIGVGVAQRVSEESTDDVMLRRFLENEGAGYDFYLLNVTCSLYQAKNEPFAAAIVALELAGEDPSDPAPIAWSMDPVRLFHPVEISRTISLSPSLKIMGVGLETKVEVGDKRERQEVFLEALYELESTPTWALYRTGSAALRGLQEFKLVIQAPKGATTLGNVAASATVERKRFGLMAYHAALPGQPGVSFKISPSTAETARLGGSGS
jgi:hypothetical protein